MSGINKAIIIGRLGQDPESRAVQGGSLTNFSVAVSSKHNDKEYTEWIRIVAFGKLADICNKYLAKGSQVYIEGRIQTREWTDKDGAKRFSTEIVAQNVQFLDSKNKANNDDGSDDGSVPY